MQELYDSDYKLANRPGTSNWDSFEYGNALWQRIYKEKLEPFEEEYKNIDYKDNGMKWLLENERGAVYTGSPYLS